MQARWSCAAALLASATPHRAASCWCTGGASVLGRHPRPSMRALARATSRRRKAMGMRGGDGRARGPDARRDVRWARARAGGGAAQGGGVARQQAVLVSGAVLGRAGGGRGARPVGGGQPTSGTLEGRRGHDPRGDPRG
eukprot:scaffold604_cov59-Phaeocystis_antarctica.AAC.9